jgi:DnaJ homolog subfamily C member 7
MPIKHRLPSLRATAPKRPGESAPNSPLADATSRGMNSGSDADAARQPGQSLGLGPTKDWKNSREFDETHQKDRNITAEENPDQVAQSTNHPQDTARSASQSPTGKLTSPSRSQSYTEPLPLFADASRARREGAPLTEQNLRNLLRSFQAEDSSKTSTPAGRTYYRSETGSAPRTNTKFAPAPTPAVGATAAGRTGSGSGRAAFASAPPVDSFAPAATGPNLSSMPKSKSPSKSPKKLDKEKRKARHDTETHPLNLPPDQLRAHLAHMARQEAESASRMSMDRDTPEANNYDSARTNGTAPTSQPATPSREAPGAFPQQDDAETAPNGTNGHQDERSPTPPPHTVPPAPKVDPEACKAAGNKFFKAKDYDRAIQEYTKGMPIVEFIDCPYRPADKYAQPSKQNPRIQPTYPTEPLRTYQQTNTALH